MQGRIFGTAHDDRVGNIFDQGMVFDGIVFGLGEVFVPSMGGGADLTHGGELHGSHHAAADGKERGEQGGGESNSDDGYHIAAGDWPACSS